MSSESSVPGQQPEPQQKPPLQSDNFRRLFLLILLVGITIIFLNMVKIFFLPVLLAAVFATLFYPFYRWLTKVFGNRRSLSAILCCLILFLGLLTPIYVVAYLVSKEVPGFYHSMEDRIEELVAKGDQGLLGRVKGLAWVQRLGLDTLDWKSNLKDFAAKGGSLLASAIRRTSGGAFQAIASLFVTLFIMFYFFRDGESLIRSIGYLIPLDEKHKEAIMSRFASVSRASIKGTILIGLTQSTVGAITLWAFGVGSPMVWGVVMAVLSVIPLLGAWLVMHSAALIQVLMGHIWQGVGIFLITVLIVSTIDNIMRPRLVGQYTGMHDLIIFFSAIGGIATFGAMGFIVGPVIAAFFVAIIDIYTVEFRSQLELN